MRPLFYNGKVKGTSGYQVDDPAVGCRSDFHWEHSKQRVWVLRTITSLSLLEKAHLAKCTRAGESTLGR